jgi:hypothetical protein
MDQRPAGDRANLDGHVPIPALVGRAVADLWVLFRAEAREAERELKAYMRLKAAGLGTLLVAAALAFIAVVFACLAAGAALTLVVPAWAAALIVAGALLIIGSIAGLVGVRILRTPFTLPADVRRRLQEDVDWLRTNVWS